MHQSGKIPSKSLAACISSPFQWLRVEGISPITDGVKIQGAGAARTIIDGNHADIVLYVQNEDLELNHVPVQGGNSQAGGGIRLYAGSSEFTNLVIRQNNALTGGGGLYLANGALLKLRRSAIL